MADKVKTLGDKHFPGMGTEYEIGAVNVGVTVVNCTLGALSNTALTDAQLIASPPNTSTAKATGPIVHSFGTPPTFAFVQARDNSAGGFASFAYCTADNSAVYFRALMSTGAQVGISVRAVIVR